MLPFLAVLAAAAPAAPAASATATCAAGHRGATTRVGAHDLHLGPLTLRGRGPWATRRRDAFRHRGWSVPATLLNHERVTLAVPASLRGHVGFAYTRSVRRRVARRGVRAASSSVRFAACGGSAQRRTGWSGGIVVDHPRCATFIVTSASGHRLRRRAPLGRRC